MKNLMIALGFAALLMSNQNVQAQDSQLVTLENTATVDMLTGIGEKTNSGAYVVSSLQEGVAITKLNDKFGLVNAQGVEIVSPRFDAIHPFQNGYAAVKLHGKWSFINKQGKKLAPFQYDWVGSFQEGAAPVKINGKWGFVNEQGAAIVEAEFDMVRGFENGTALVSKGGNWYTLTIQGALLPAAASAKVSVVSEI